MYSDKPEVSDANQLVERYAPLVKRIAYHMLARMPASVQLDDLLQAGLIGLLEASRKYETGKGASFETFAGIRIRGSMIDEVRKGDWSPRSVHRKARQVTEAIKIVEDREGRDASDFEVAQQMGVSRDEYHAILQDTSSSRLFSLEELQQSDDGGSHDYAGTAENPSEEVVREHFAAALTEKIKGLSEREQLALSLYYEDELNLKEIGLILEVSESRVSQILSQTTKRLRSRLTEW